MFEDTRCGEYLGKQWLYLSGNPIEKPVEFSPEVREYMERRYQREMNWQNAIGTALAETERYREECNI